MIKRILVRGERCTGTNYMYRLIEKNFKSITLSSDLGWKHSYINIFNKNLYNQNEYLTIFMFRNAVDWIGSMYLHRWHFNKPMYNNISEFIHNEPLQIIFGLKELTETNDVSSELLWERHPFTLEKPKNICQLRNWKNENFLSTTNILNNVMFVCYEKLYENPKSIINEINEKYIFEKINSFQNVNEYKGLERKGIYIPKKYDNISDLDYKFIKENLNWELENRIGYTEQMLDYHFDKYKN